MLEVLSVENLMTLTMLIFLQAVLGFDNLLYLSIESKRVEEDKQNYVRRVGIVIAIVLRLVLLFALIHAIQYFKAPILSIDIKGILVGAFNVQSIVEILGGGFIIYTAVKEISHMLVLEEIEGEGNGAKRSVVASIFWIAVMNLVFSFDSILSALALTNVFWVMAIAIIISGILMIYMADRVSEFLKANRMYEVLGLFILFIVGVMLLSEGGHYAGLSFFGYLVEPMSKTTFYFAVSVLVFCDIIQTKYQKKLLSKRKTQIADP